MNSNHRIFISYKSENANFVRWVVDFLKSAGFDVWFAEYRVLTHNYDSFASDLENNIKSAIHPSDHAVVFTNAKWAGSPHCRLEVETIKAHIGPGSGVVTHVLLPNEEFGEAISHETLAYIRGLPDKIEIEQPSVEIAHTTAGKILSSINPSASLAPFERAECREERLIHGTNQVLLLALPPHQRDQRRTSQLTINGTAFGLEVTTPVRSQLTPWEISLKEVLDDREVYNRLKDKALQLYSTDKAWGSGDLEEIGLHLYWDRQPHSEDANQQRGYADPHSQLAQTFIESKRDETADTDLRRAIRVYQLFLKHPWNGQIEHFELRFATDWRPHHLTIDDFYLNCAELDTIAGTAAYTGLMPTRNIGSQFFLHMFSACLFALVFIRIVSGEYPSAEIWLLVISGLCLWWLGVCSNRYLLSFLMLPRPVGFPREPLPSTVQFESLEHHFRMRVPPGWVRRKAYAEYLLEIAWHIKKRLGTKRANTPAFPLSSAVVFKPCGRTRERLAIRRDPMLEERKQLRALGRSNVDLARDDIEGNDSSIMGKHIENPEYQLVKIGCETAWKLTYRRRGRIYFKIAVCKGDFEYTFQSTIEDRGVDRSAIEKALQSFEFTE